MKRFAVAGATVILTTGLAVFAIAVAQRDSRERELALNHVEPEYANEASVPIALKPDVESGMIIEQPNEPPIFQDSNVRLQTIAAPRTASSRTELPTQIEEPPPFDAVGIPPLTSFSELESTSDDGSDRAVDVVTASGLGAPPNPSQAVQTTGGPSLMPPPPLGRELPINPPTSPMVAPLAGQFNPLGPSLNRTAPSSNPPPAASLMPPSLPNYPPGLTPPANTAMSARQQNPGAATLGVPLNAPMNATTGNAAYNDRPQAGYQGASMPSPSGMPLATQPLNGATPSFPDQPNQSSQAASQYNSASSPRSGTPSPSYSPTSSSPTATAANRPDAPRDLPRTSGVNASNAIQNRMASTPSQFASLASPAPGSRQTDGKQKPSLEIQKNAPAEVLVGQPATFGVLLRNVGDATAYDVSVVDSVPRGTRLVKTNPPAEHRADGTLVWSLGELPAGTEQVLTVDLIPEAEGEIGSVASVNFAAQASVRTVSTQPKLVVQQIGDKQVLVGKAYNIRVTVTNEGTGVARDVALEEDVPLGMRHPSGNSIGVLLGDLAPGQSITTDLELVAVEPGLSRNVMRAVASNTGAGESSVEVEVVAPKLRVEVAGPKLRYLERQATYQVNVVNEGTSMAYDVEIIANLPRGLQYNSCGNYGQYLADRHAIVWKLEELPVGRPAITEMTLLPVNEGEFAIRMQSSALGIEAEPVEKQVRIEGQSELAFSIDDDNDPIETDGQTTYLVRVTNNGTRIDEDVQVMIELPQGAQLTDVKAPVAFKETAQGIVFEPIGQMRAKDEQLYRFSVQFQRAGIQIVRAHLKSRLRPEPVVNEESTKVYFDQ